MRVAIEPARLSADLGGKWHRSYGTAPCPVCQSEHRKDQNALTINQREGRLLLHCKKSGCDFRDILGAAGITPGTLELDQMAIANAGVLPLEALQDRQLARLLARIEKLTSCQRVRCGAKTRQGHPCKNLSEPGKRRCKFHGGKSTGPRTPGGRKRISEAQKARWHNQRNERK